MQTSLLGKSANRNRIINFINISDFLSLGFFSEYNFLAMRLSLFCHILTFLLSSLSFSSHRILPSFCFSTRPTKVRFAACYNGQKKSFATGRPALHPSIQKEIHMITIDLASFFVGPKGDPNWSCFRVHF